MKKFVTAKLHGIKVTDANLEYHGSITLDPIHCREAGILPLEFVEIWNKASGARISTYVIYGEAGSNCCVLNGSAARTCQVGDELIICTSSYEQADVVTELNPIVLTFNEDNSINEVLKYKVEKTEDWYDFEILRDQGKSLKAVS